MRKLWTDYVVWTRNYIIAAVGAQPDAKPSATRLLKNQEDIQRRGDVLRCAGCDIAPLVLGVGSVVTMKTGSATVEACRRHLSAPVTEHRFNLHVARPEALRS